MRIARGEEKKKRQKRGEGFLLHSGSRITRVFKPCQVVGATSEESGVSKAVTVC
jgi:hypothetical protein